MAKGNASFAKTTWLQSAAGPPGGAKLVATWPACFAKRHPFWPHWILSSLVSMKLSSLGKTNWWLRGLGPLLEQVHFSQRHRCDCKAAAVAAPAWQSGHLPCHFRHSQLNFRQALANFKLTPRPLTPSVAKFQTLITSLRLPVPPAVFDPRTGRCPRALCASLPHASALTHPCPLLPLQLAASLAGAGPDAGQPDPAGGLQAAAA